MARPLTKTRFKQALECPTALYYGNHKERYYDSRADDDFLQALAHGGIQVGELAKFLYDDDPVGNGITVEETDYTRAMAETARRLSQPGKVVIAEAALGVPGYFIRVDVLIKDEESRTVQIIEVKSKSVGKEDLEKGFRNKQGRWMPKWLPYLYDIAFQSVVAERALADLGYTIVPKLLLVDKEVACDVDGLNQYFRIVPDPDRQGRSFAEIQEGVTREGLGDLSVLREVSMGPIVDDLRGTPVPLHPSNVAQDKHDNLEAFMRWCGELQAGDEQFFARPHRGCKGCPFKPDPAGTLKAGIHECWINAGDEGWLTTRDGGRRGLCAKDLKEPLSIELWGGGAGPRSLAGEVLDVGCGLIRDIETDPLQPKKPSDCVGLTPHRRRELQVDAARNPDKGFQLAEAKLREMDSWEWPLHMIDFETSTPAIPFFAGMRPYETLAFQFSHHLMERVDGRVQIRHATQWISTEAGHNPGVDFVRALKSALMPDGRNLAGTVFRYHNHENTVLRKLRDHLEGRRDLEDQVDLIAFIERISHPRRKEKGERGEKDMVDLFEIVKHGYYSTVSGGSISLKRILPAIIHDAPSVRQFFGQPGLYGRDRPMASLNFEEHTWITKATGLNPYKTLPPVFSAETVSTDPRLFHLSDYWDEREEDESTRIEEGGVAMTSYNYTRFADLSDTDRAQIREALLRYCELDTLAMVMLVLGLFELRGLPLKVRV